MIATESSFSRHTPIPKVKTTTAAKSPLFYTREFAFFRNNSRLLQVGTLSNVGELISKLGKGKELIIVCKHEIRNFHVEVGQ